MAVYSPHDAVTPRAPAPTHTLPRTQPLQTTRESLTQTYADHLKQAPLVETKQLSFPKVIPQASPAPMPLPRRDEALLRRQISRLVPKTIARQAPRCESLVLSLCKTGETLNQHYDRTEVGAADQSREQALRAHRRALSLRAGGTRLGPTRLRQVAPACPEAQSAAVDQIYFLACLMRSLSAARPTAPITT